MQGTHGTIEAPQKFSKRDVRRAVAESDAEYIGSASRQIQHHL